MDHNRSPHGDSYTVKDLGSTFHKKDNMRTIR